MRVIFLTLAYMDNIKAKGIYSDLMRKFMEEGHKIYIVTPHERRMKKSTTLTEKDGVQYLGVKTLNIQKSNVIEKGIGTILIEQQYKAAIREHFEGISFDLILYSTPPITLAGVVSYLKKKNHNAISYLLLKDIFPQNAVDVGILTKKSPLYWYFRWKEKLLYNHSDYIGCMSPANVVYFREHNRYYPADKVEVAPNSIELGLDKDELTVEKISIRQKYGIPKDRTIFIYGGNLGRPQGIDYLIECLDSNKNREDCCFVVIGNGTEYKKLSTWYGTHNCQNVRLMKGLPKHEYDQLVKACDVGLIFLDHRFTIPNYPSRLLSYLENKLPVICATDDNTDIGRIAEENGYGFWCESINPDDFTALVDKMLKADIKKMGELGYEYLTQNYLVEHTYQRIVSHLG